MRLEKIEKTRQADAEEAKRTRAEMEEIKRLRRGDADLIAELKKMIRSEIKDFQQGI